MPVARFTSSGASIIRTVLIVLTLAAGLLLAPGTAAPADAAAAPNGFKSVGYLPSWAGDVNKVQYRKLTHINYAFVMPDATGNLPAPPNPTKLRNLVRLGHSHNVKVLISIGGWNNGDDSPFETLAASAATRRTFVNNVVKMVAEYGLDGADIDWEYPNPGASADHFTTLMAALGAAMHARGKLLTAAVISNGNTQGVQPAVFGHLDFLNIMLYDGGSPHANYDWAINYVKMWQARGLPASKTVVGLPFYSRPTYASYATLVAMDPANADRDCTTVNGGQACYNGRATVAAKTGWALVNAGGMMNWELSNDTTDGTSLVDVIYRAAAGQRAGEITGTAGRCIDVQSSRTEDGTPIQLYGCNGTNAQWWAADGSGAIRALGKCLDVSAGSTADGAVVQLWDCNGTGAQTWRILPNGTVHNPQSGKCLDAAGFGTGDGTRLQIWSCSGGSNQQWRTAAWPTAVRSGPITGTSAKCVDVRWSGTADGTPIHLFGCNGSQAQRWTVDGSGAVRALGKCLDVPGSSRANGAQLQLWTCNGTGAQVWQIRPDGTLRNPNSNKCMDATAFGTADGTRLQIWDCHAGSNQVWRLP